MKSNPIPSISAKQMALVDQLMLETYQIGLEQMMENAGRHLASLAFTRLRQHHSLNPAEARITLVIGPGNNGGGGLVAARYLSNWGARVTVILTPAMEALRPVLRARLLTLTKLPVRVLQWDAAERSACLAQAQLIIDSVLGYNATGNPYGTVRQAILAINTMQIPVLALDIPSGLDATTGKPGRPCIKASATLTLALPKTGLTGSAGRRYRGDLYLADIGIPPTLYTALDLPAQPIFTETPILKLS